MARQRYGKEVKWDSRVLSAQGLLEFRNPLVAWRKPCRDHPGALPSIAFARHTWLQTGSYEADIVELR